MGRWVKSGYARCEVLITSVNVDIISYKHEIRLITSTRMQRGRRETEEEEEGRRERGD